MPSWQWKVFSTLAIVWLQYAALLLGSPDADRKLYPDASLSGKGHLPQSNIFLTLACGVLMLSLFFGFSENGGAAKDRKHGLRIAAGVLVLLAGLLFSEGGMALLPFMILTTFLEIKFFSETCPM